MKMSDLLGEGYYSKYDNNRTGFGRRPREDDEYVNGPDPETFKIHCTMTDKETGQPRKRTATVTTAHGYGHAVNMALKMYHEQGYDDAKEVHNENVAESATAGATNAASIGTVDAPQLSPGKARGKKSYTGSPGKSGTKAPPQPKVVQPKTKAGTAVNALDMKGANIFGGATLKR